MSIRAAATSLSVTFQNKNSTDQVIDAVKGCSQRKNQNTLIPIFERLIKANGLNIATIKLRLSDALQRTNVTEVDFKTAMNKLAEMDTKIGEMVVEEISGKLKNPKKNPQLLIEVIAKLKLSTEAFKYHLVTETMSGKISSTDMRAAMNAFAEMPSLVRHSLVEGLKKTKTKLEIPGILLQIKKYYDVDRDEIKSHLQTALNKKEITQEKFKETMDMIGELSVADFEVEGKDEKTAKMLDEKKA